MQAGRQAQRLGLSRHQPSKAGQRGFNGSTRQPLSPRSKRGAYRGSAGACRVVPGGGVARVAVARDAGREVGGALLHIVADVVVARQSPEARRASGRHKGAVGRDVDVVGDVVGERLLTATAARAGARARVWAGPSPANCGRAARKKPAARTWTSGELKTSMLWFVTYTNPPLGLAVGIPSAVLFVAQSVPLMMTVDASPPTSKAPPLRACVPRRARAGASGRGGAIQASAGSRAAGGAARTRPVPPRRTCRPRRCRQTRSR